MRKSNRLPASLQTLNNILDRAVKAGYEPVTSDGVMGKLIAPTLPTYQSLVALASKKLFRKRSLLRGASLRHDGMADSAEG
ncbi:hypothetical protein B0T26DRAFT_706048 [Lasiosphaeria miniovina]|uniref:Uncharacterized protein n=1 Tax=Lasiosphaeria miniovina TaxID=1954250 RepID=A0AA40AWH6_9PEZI|nr:uncharacterized protein B0T26DRAFT_706048 [Lasiosphaeria miniovina]KAK0723302.1 hypothetical protein B0T26DRAFT_706048 [Lasiosphaeria miniovina]